MPSRRKLPEARPVGRRPAVKTARYELIIICEGETTEPSYLVDFANEHRHQLVMIKTFPKGGAIRALVDKAIEHKRAREIEARKTKDDLDNLFEVWAVSDVDDHPKLQEALNLAEAQGIRVALSNPCFELWGVLHYRRHDAPDGRRVIQRLLGNLMNGYSHNKSPRFNYKEISGRFDQAVENARWIEQRRKEEDKPRGCPSTNVYELLFRIIRPWEDIA